MPRLARTTHKCPRHWKMAGATLEEITRIFENRESRNKKRFILRLKFHCSICNVVYIVKIFNSTSNKSVFIFSAAQMSSNYFSN